VKSKVAFSKTGAQTAIGVADTVRRAMRLVDWSAGIAPVSLFLKVNLLSREVMPGQCTSPWVFAGVLAEVRERFPQAEIYYGDCEVSSSPQVEDAVRNWGILEVGERLGARFINLSRCPTREVEVGPVFGRLGIPEVLLDAEALITIPVVKTHCITPFTGALKNQWGMLPWARFKYHPVVHEAIVEVNAFFAERMLLGVADMTVAMEGPGPRAGYPKICDVVLASKDLVALDVLAAQYMGFQREEVDFLLYAASAGLGGLEAEVLGDAFEQNVFVRGEGRDYLISRWRDRLDSLPVLRKLLVKDWFFKPVGWLASRYARHVWYRRKGRPLAREVCATSGYGAEFSHLLG